MTGMWGEAVRSPLKLLEGMLSTCRVFSRSCNMIRGVDAGSHFQIAAGVTLGKAEPALSRQPPQLTVPAGEAR